MTAAGSRPSRTGRVAAPGCLTHMCHHVHAAGGALLATSPDAVWWGGALAAALTGAGLLRLGDRIPDPLLQAQCPPPQAVSAADMDSACHSQMNS